MSLPSKEKSYKLLENSGLRIASIGLSCMGLLFLPITRGSILLKLIDVPFEQAARYQIVRWQSNHIANLPGVIVLFVGLLMWGTSLNPVRKRYFELFYYTHHLYTIFIIVLALHVGDSVFSCAAGGIFLFILDRFLRFWQSRRKAGMVSATCLPCGTLELVLSKPRGFRGKLKGIMKNKRTCKRNTEFYILSPQTAAPLKHSSSWSFDEKLLIQFLYKILVSVSKTSPIILYLRDVGQLLFRSQRVYTLFQKMFQKPSGPNAGVVKVCFIS